MTAAQTGHLVLATLHTTDAAQTIERIVGMFTAQAQAQTRMLLAQTLLGVVCLRLVPRRNVPGRLLACEILVATDAVRSLVRDAKIHQLRNAIATGRQFGMQTLESHLSDLVQEGAVSLEAAREQSDRPREIGARDRAVAG